MPHIQLRDVPPDLHDRVRRRAERSGISMREYVLRLIEADQGPPKDTWEETVRKMEAIAAHAKPGGPTAAEVIRESREEREAQLLQAVERRR